MAALPDTEHAMYPPPAQVSDTALATLSECCGQLSSVFLEMDTSVATPAPIDAAPPVSCAGLVGLARGCRQLTVLSLAGMSAGMGRGEEGASTTIKTAPMLRNDELLISERGERNQLAQSYEPDCVCICVCV